MDMFAGKIEPRLLEILIKTSGLDERTFKAIYRVASRLKNEYARSQCFVAV